jgi:hypothetical protein
VAETGGGGEAPRSLLELFWRLLGDQERQSALTKLGTTAVCLVCLLLICLGLIAGSILFMLDKTGVKGPGLPVLVPSGLAFGVTLIGVIIGIAKRMKRRRFGVRAVGSARIPRSLPPNRPRSRRAPGRRRQ